MITSYVRDGARIETRIADKFSLLCDQPPPFGEDAAPAPYDLFLAGVAACSAYYAQRYCRKWKLSHEGVAVELEPVFDAQHKLEQVRLRLRLPAGFPAEHREGILRNAAACPVKKALESPPVLSLDVAAD